MVFNDIGSIMYLLMLTNIFSSNLWKQNEHYFALNHATTELKNVVM